MGYLVRLHGLHVLKGRAHMVDFVKIAAVIVSVVCRDNAAFIVESGDGGVILKVFVKFWLP